MEVVVIVFSNKIQLENAFRVLKVQTALNFCCQKLNLIETQEVTTKFRIGSIFHAYFGFIRDWALDSCKNDGVNITAV